MSKFFCAGQGGEGYYTVEHATEGVYDCQSRTQADKLVKTLNTIQAAERNAVVEECIQFIMDGHFLHDEAPPKLFVTELTREMRKQLIR